MRKQTYISIASVLAAIAVASGCGAQNGSIAALPNRGVASSRSAGAPTVQRLASVKRAIRLHSRMLPAAGKGRLLYVADPWSNELLVYTYPQLSGAGVISGFASVDGVCTDRQGYVWVVDTSDVVVWEFAHGGTEPINYLQPGDTNGNPGVSYGCAVNERSGDLAVAGFGGLTVFRNGQQSHATYWDYNFLDFHSVGYDGSGNLYADGLLSYGLKFGLVELPAGSSSINEVTLSGGTLAGPGGIQWDGKYLDIGDSASGTIYQTDGASILGSIGTAAACQGQFYILSNHKRVIVPDPCSARTGIYAYPAGGSAIKFASGGQQSPDGAAISMASR